MEIQVDQSSKQARVNRDRTFYPSADSLITQSREKWMPQRATRIIVKAYLSASSCCQTYFTCACAEFSQSCIYAGGILGVAPSVVNRAVSGSGHANAAKKYRFQVNEYKIEASKLLGHKYALPEWAWVLMALRVGMGYLDMHRLVEFANNRNELLDCLDAFMNGEVFQVRFLQEELDAQLLRSGGNISLAVERVRKGLELGKSAEFGKLVFKTIKELAAKGHSREL